MRHDEMIDAVLATYYQHADAALVEVEETDGGTSDREEEDIDVDAVDQLAIEINNFFG